MTSRNLGYNTKKNPYLLQQINTASPEKVILMLYDLGLQSCRAGDNQKASKVLVELISALNFDQGEISLMFFDLYRYALDQVSQRRFDDAVMVFEELREIWESNIIKNAALKN